TVTHSFVPAPAAMSGRVGDAVEEPPPQLERARDGPPHPRLKLGGGREADDDVVADRAVLAVRLPVHVPDGHLPARASVMPLECSALTARGNSRTGRKTCTTTGPRAAQGSCPSAMRGQSGWRPKARPASISARRSSTNAPPPGIGRRVARRAGACPQPTEILPSAHVSAVFSA